MKILINNEEVLSDKNFTIKQEMLNTPSVILNNVYPASWEENKDYVSNFYYPPDYSKCLIYDEYQEPETGTTISGNNLNIDYNSQKLWEYKIYGDLNGLTGLQTITINNTDYDINLGKNLFNVNSSYTTGNMSGSGVMSKETIDTFELSDTGFSIGNSTAWRGVAYDNTYLEAGETYTISLEANNNAFFLANYYYDENGDFISTTTLLNNTSTREATFTVPNNTVSTKVVFECRTANTIITFSNIQIEKGNTGTSYASFFTPIVLGENDYIYKNGSWYYSLNGNNYSVPTGLSSQLNAVSLVNGENEVSISNGTLEIHYNYTDATSNLIFCGVVKNSGNISLNPRHPHFCSLQILDFKMFLSEIVLDFVIANKTVEQAVQQVINYISDYGFVLGNIQLTNASDVIGAYSTKDKSPYDVFNYIADITQSRWTTRMIDENTVAVDFYDPSLMVQGTTIDYTNEFFEDYLIDDITYSFGTYDYRNKQIMTSDEVLANISSTETIIANGYQKQYNTEQKIGDINSITVNGVVKTFTTEERKQLGQTADFYYKPTEQYFESDNALTAGDTIVIDYVSVVQGRQIILNPSEIERISNSTGRNGTLARYENRNDATTSTELQKIGQSYIKYKGTPEIKLTITSRANTWEVGQRVQFNAPINELSAEYMVKTKSIDYIATVDTIFYTYELTSNFNSETEINYFDNQRAKNSGNIGAGQFIARNIDIENAANIIFYDTTITEVE